MKHSLLVRALILSVCLLGGISKISAQSIDRIRINEIQVINTDGLRDEYGQLGSWIELHNTGYGKVDIGGCYLIVNDHEYRIPIGDPQTIVPSQGYALFYAAGTPNKGTFHTNFNLHNTNFIEFYDVDKKFIDRLEFNTSEMRENISYGWIEDNNTEIIAHLPATTPRANNNTAEKIARGEVFRQADPTGIVLTLTNIAAVGIALTVLYLIFKNIGKFFIRSAQKKTVKTQSKDVTTKINAEDGVVTSEHLAAIAIALYQYTEELHDMENTIITINRVVKAYSPWSSKIYGLTQTPIRK